MRVASLMFASTATLILVACRDDGSGPETIPLLITSMTPAPNANDVEAGAVVSVVFNVYPRARPPTNTLTFDNNRHIVE